MSSKETDKYILYYTVESYIKAGKPVSSRFIKEHYHLEVSSATIRNMMLKLEKDGYLYQPHTSAGRLPTDKGLRSYVNKIFEEAVVPEEKVNFPSEKTYLKKGDFNSLLFYASKTLSEYSNNIGFVLSPDISKINFYHIRLIKISEEKVLIILITSYNLVLTEIVRTATYFTQDELDRASYYINENFRGRNLVFVRDYLNKEVPIARKRFEKLIRKLMGFLKSYFNQEDKEKGIFLEGTSNLLEKTEFFQMDRIQSLFKNVEERAKIAKFLSDFISLDRVKVLIGSEMDLPEISDCSLVLSHYGYRRQILGSLGIIGPKRIPYKNIIPLVDCVAKKLSETISSFH